MITLYNYEDKTKETLIEKCTSELNVSLDDLIIKETESESGLIKKKKYQLTAVKKSDVISEIKSFIKELQEKFNIDITSEVTVRENTFNVMLVSSNNAILIGKEGRTIESIQIILNQFINNQIDMNVRINVDASNYKGKKIKNFEYEIKKIAKSVLRTKVAVKLDPMNSYNRRIVHNVVSEFENLTSLSEGEEPNRYVVIDYKED